MNAVIDRRFKASLRLDWTVKPLGDVCRTTSGGTPSRKRPDYFSGDIPWVKSGELTDGLVSQVSEFISEEALSSSSAKLFPAGTLLVAMYGATVGKLGVLARAAATNQAVCAIFPQPGIDAKFLFWYLRYQRSHLIAQAVGGAQPNISQTILRDLAVPIPTIGDQRAIVAEIEKQFSRLDEAVANLQRVKANLKRYKTSVLKAAVEGRLVPTEVELARTGSGYETGEELLNRIIRARRDQQKEKFRQTLPYDSDNLPALPAGWTWASLAMLSWGSSYGTSAKCSNDETGVPILRIPNVQNGTLDLEDLKFAPPALDIAQSDAVCAGDMLVIRTNGSKSLIGRAALVLEEPARKLGFASYLIRFRLLRIARLAHWLKVVWPESRMRSWLETRAATSAGQHNISQSVLATAAIPMPPEAEQHRIVAEVDRRFSLVHEVEREVDANLKRAHGLKQATLTKAFAR